MPPARAAGKGTALSPRAHRQRIASAVVLGLAALGVTLMGGPGFVLFWAIAAAAIGWEWVGLVRPRPRVPVLVIGAAALAATALALALGKISVVIPALVLGAALILAVAKLPERGWAAFGVFYAAAALVPIVLLREDPRYGLFAVLWLFAVVWATDIAAFYAGRALGGPLLWAAVSPKKTWSGAVVGTLAGVIAGAGLIMAAPLVGIAAPGLKPSHALIALAVSVASQAGDLFESRIKRKFGVKDSSQLIPGHGGFMDRLDGFVAGALLALLIGLARTGAPATGLLAW